MLSSDADTRQRIEATDTRQVRYTFAKTRDKLGNTLYRFVGVFKTVSKSEDTLGRLVFKHEKISDRVLIPDPTV